MGDEKTLVTGAAGFLGKHVAAHLTRVGHSVTGFDPCPVARGDLLRLGYVVETVSGHDVGVPVKRCSHPRCWVRRPITRGSNR